MRSALLLVLLAGVPAAEPAVADSEPEELVDVTRTDGRLEGRTVAERRQALLRAGLTTRPSKATAKESIHHWMARILLDQDRAGAWAAWQTAATRLAEGTGDRLDPFDKQALVHGWLLAAEQTEVPAAVIAATRRYVARWKHRVWKGYGALNYRLMNDGAGFIAAERFPDLVDADGLDAAGIRAATKARLLGYCDAIVRRNHHEYAAPTYGGVDLSALLLLADFARDAEVRQRATLTLDWLLVTVACAWNQGWHTSPAGRAKYLGSTMTGPDHLDALGAIGWLFFGAQRPVAGPCGHHSFWFAVRPAGYAPPDLIAALANDRDQPVEHRGSYVDGTQSVRMTIVHDPAFSLASAWEDMGGPRSGHWKESRRQVLRWVSDQPGSTFFIHQDNFQRPYQPQTVKANPLGYGENPYGQTLQRGGVLLGLSVVPEDFPFHQLRLPFTTGGAILRRREHDGWILCHGGSLLFAVRLAVPGTWDPRPPREAKGFDVLVADGRRQAWVLQTRPQRLVGGATPEEDLDRFAAALGTVRFDTSRLADPQPSVTYQDLEGHRLDLRWRPLGTPPGDHHRLDGVPVDYAVWPLLGNPWVRQAVNGDRLEIRRPEGSLTYDFRTWTRRP